MTSKTRVYTGSILFLFFIWLFGIIYNGFTKDSKDTTLSIEGFNNPSKQKSLTAKDYEELFFVLKTLMRLDYEQIRSVIIGNDLNSVFDLARRIKKNNKPQKLYRMNVKFDMNETDGTVTLTDKTYVRAKSNDPIESYLTNIKMIAFADFIQIPGFSLDLIVSLINVYKIPNVSIKSYPNIIKALDIDNENKPVETLGLKYFLNKESITDTYFEFLRYVLTDNSFIKGKTLRELKLSLNSILENKSFSFRENIEIALADPNRIKKELNTVLVLFKHNEMVNKIDIISVEDLIKNKKLLETKVLNETNKAALNNVKNEIDSVFLSTLNSYDLENDLFDIDLLKEYNVLYKIKEKLKIVREEKIKSNLIDFGELPEKVEKNKNTEFEQFLKRDEYITIEKLNQLSNDEEMNKIETNASSIFNIRENFAKTLNSIIEEMTLLFNNNSNYEAADKDKLENGAFVDKYLYYFKNIMLIFTRDGRLLYSGMIILLIALFIFFIEISYY